MKESNIDKEQILEIYKRIGQNVKKLRQEKDFPTCIITCNRT